MRTSIKIQSLSLKGLVLPVITVISLLGCLSASAFGTLPTVKVGGPQAITMPSSTVTLYGSCAPAAGRIINYHIWSKISGGPATIAAPFSDTTFVSGLTEGNYTFQFTVTDDKGQVSTATVLIQVYTASTPPVVKIIAAPTITLPVSSVNLFGSATPAAGRNIISRVWTKTSGGAATIIAPASDTTAVTGMSAGTYTFLLSVMDNGGLKASGTVTITVKSPNPPAAATPPASVPNLPPTVKVGGPQAITQPSSTVTLYGSCMPTAGRSITSHTWTKTSGGTASIVSPYSDTTFVSGLTQGNYLFLYTATDNKGQVSTASVIIQVYAPSTPPVVKVIGPQTIALPTSTVTLSGFATPGKGRDIISHVWTKTSGGTATITSPDSDTTTVTGLAKGTYTFLLSVMDDGGLKASGTVTITVNAAPPPPPPSTKPAPPSKATPPPTPPPTTTPPPTPPPTTTPPAAPPPTSSSPPASTSSAPTTPSKYSVANGEYASFILDNTTQTLYGVGSGVTGIGSNTGIAGSAIPCQFPQPNTKIAFVAAGLHTASCVDVNGKVYFSGPNEDGSMGNGTTTGGVSNFVQVTTDATGKPFNNVKYLRMGSSIFTGGAGYGAIIYAIKNDGTLWVWGNTQGGYGGNGTYGGVVTQPTQITSFPAGTQITKLVVANIVIALDANGGVWTWAGNGEPALLGNASQTNYETPHQITLPSKAIDIAGGGFFSYALLANQSLYGWGWYTGYMGVGSTAASAAPGVSPPTEPILLDDDLDLPAKILHLSTNNTTTYAILTDGSLWAWGGNECGQAGIGQELDYKKYTVSPAPYGGTPSPYNWDQDMSTAQFQVHKPVNIAPGLNNFVGLSEGVCAVWYKYAVDANGQLYSWGRNKSGVLGNGVMEGDYILGNIGAAYPNSFDVPYLTAINPFELTETILTTSPECLSVAGISLCSLFNIPFNTAPVANPGANQTVPGPTAVLNGTASKDNSAIVYYVWSQVSGPNQAVISIPSGAKANLLGLTKGTYVFQLKTIDNGWMSDSAKVTITVLNTLATQNADDILSVNPDLLTNTDSSASDKAAFAIYPNPVTDQFTLVIGNKLTGAMNMQLIDATGIIRHQYSFTKDLQTMQYNISASDLPPGIYFLRVQLGTWTGTLKMIKK